MAHEHDLLLHTYLAGCMHSKTGLSTVTVTVYEYEHCHGLNLPHYSVIAVKAITPRKGPYQSGCRPLQRNKYC